MRILAAAFVLLVLAPATGDGAVSRSVRTAASATHLFTMRSRRHLPRPHDAVLWADAA